MNNSDSIAKLRTALKYTLLNVKFILSFLMQFLFNSNGQVIVYIQGGLGDFILATPFVKSLSHLIGSNRLKILYRDDDAENSPNTFGWGQTRKFTDLSGMRHNPLKEWVRDIYGVSDSAGVSNAKTITCSVFYAPAWAFLFGYVSNFKQNKLIYSPFFAGFIPSKNCDQVYTRLYEYRSASVKIVGLHLRRNADIILDIAGRLQLEHPNIIFLIFGSTEHQPTVDFSALKNTISLVDSYTKGLSTLDVLYLSRATDLFIGGRGGFELFNLVNEVPTITCFDTHGLVERKRWIWPDSLWVGHPTTAPNSSNTDAAVYLAKALEVLNDKHN